MRYYFLLVLLFASTANAKAEEKPYAIHIKDHRFIPSELSVPADTRVKLQIKNEDVTPEEFESTDLDIEKIVTGGGEISLYIQPQQPGSYKFFGDFHPDSAQGILTVK